MDTLGARLRALRGKDTSKEIAARVGITQAYYSQLENNLKTPSLDVLHKLANAFGVSTALLLGEEPFPTEGTPEFERLVFKLIAKKEIFEGKSAKNKSTLGEQTTDISNETTLRTPTQHNMVRIKMLPKDYKICCGQGIAYLDDAVAIDHEMLLMDEELARYYSTADLYGICVDGDSMEPYIPDGATVVITTNFDTLYSGDVAVINYNGRQIVRGFIERGRSQEIVLRAHNKDYDDIIITPDDDLCICGKVLRVISSTKPRSVI